MVFPNLHSSDRWGYNSNCNPHPPGTFLCTSLQLGCKCAKRLQVSEICSEDKGCYTRYDWLWMGAGQEELGQIGGGGVSLKSLERRPAVTGTRRQGDGASVYGIRESAKRCQWQGCVALNQILKVWVHYPCWPTGANEASRSEQLPLLTS